MKIMKGGRNLIFLEETDRLLVSYRSQDWGQCRVNCSYRQVKTCCTVQVHPSRLMESADSTAVEAGKVRGTQSQSECRFDVSCGSPLSLMALIEVDSYTLFLSHHFRDICENRFFFFLIWKKASFVFIGKWKQH